MLVKSDAVDVIVVDSVAALVPRAGLEGEMGDSHMGLHARLMSQALRKLTALTARSKTLIIFINQLRMKIGVMFGNPETTTGGNALKFYASVRLDIRRIGALKDGEQVTGNRTRVKVVKNKLAAPFRETEFDIFYGHGVSRAGEVIDLGVEAGILEKSGAWIGYGGERLGNGRDAARQHLLENQNLLKELRTKLLEHAGIGVPSSATPPAPAVETPAPAPGAAGESPKPAPRAKVEKADGKAAPATKAA
jgi:recombination protein RecA